MTDEPRTSRRSQAWFGAQGRSGMVYRSWMRSQGFGHEVFDGRPVIGIATSASELAPCNAHLTRVAEAVKRGVWQAGGFPLQFPTMATGETLMRPTAMLYRNLMAMEVEELIRANPLDGVVLLSGCDKTTPAMLMGAASVDLPAVMVTGGPMLNGKYRGQDVGSGTHVWKFEEDLKTGRMTEEECFFAEGCMARSNGHCMTMGTASTMACLAEALGMQLPGSAAWPAVDSRRMETAQAAGQRIVGMVEEELRPSRILTREAFENAVRVNAAIGGSTNAVIHLLAIAGRVGVDLSLRDFDELARAVPTLVNLMPSGKYLMEDFCYAGGLPAVLAELLGGGLLHGSQITVTGRTIAENNTGSTDNTGNTGNTERVGSDPDPDPDFDVITRLDAPFQPAGTGIAVLRGNLCPDGAVIKQSAASPHLLTHRGPARVFDSPEAYHEVADDPDLDIDENTVIVIRNAGPKGYPGMPEVANVPLPAKLLKAGVKDMVRVCDGRMSGTGYGTVVLHVAPEAAVGGPSPWSTTGTRSSSTSPTAPCAWTSTTPSSRDAGGRGGHPPNGTPAVTPGSTPRTSNRPTGAPTSDSCGETADTRFPETPTEGDERAAVDHAHGPFGRTASFLVGGVTRPCEARAAHSKMAPDRPRDAANGRVRRHPGEPDTSAPCAWPARCGRRSRTASRPLPHHRHGLGRGRHHHRGVGCSLRSRQPWAVTSSTSPPAWPYGTRRPGRPVRERSTHSWRKYGWTGGRADAVMLGRALLRDPYLALRRHASDRATWPAQYHRAL